MPVKFGPHGPCTCKRKREGIERDVMSHIWVDEWEMGCPKSPMWVSGDEARSGHESASSYDSREGNVGNDAFHVIGLYGLRDQISLFLEGLGAELPHGSLVCRCEEALCHSKANLPVTVDGLSRLYVRGWTAPPIVHHAQRA